MGIPTDIRIIVETCWNVFSIPVEDLERFFIDGIQPKLNYKRVTIDKATDCKDPWTDKEEGLEVADTIDVAVDARCLNNMILAYFENANTESPRSVRDIRMGSRVRKSGATAEDVESVLDHLTSEGKLLKYADGWVSADWQDLN